MMGLKTKAAVALTFMSSWFAGSKTNAQNTQGLKAPQTELQTEPVEETPSSTMDWPGTENKNPENSVTEENRTSQLQDSIELRLSEKIKQLNDSILTEQKKEKLKDSQKLMLYVIAHFEGMKCKAYWDKAGKIWTIGIGNTIRPDGKRVTRNDCIRTEEEALNYVSAHIDKKMADDMIDYLPLDKMSKEEIAVIGSLFYNCGSGILRDKEGNPSEFAQCATEYFTTHSDTAAKEFDAQYLNYCHVKKAVNKVVQERRKNELTFLHGDVKITIDEETNNDTKTVNLRQAILGSLYGCRGDPENIMSRFSEDSRYYCPTDSLKVAINKELSQLQRTPIKRTVTKKRGGR